MHPADEPGDHGEHAEVAARLHASLTAPSLDPAARARHLQAIRDRAATLPAPAPALAPAPAPAPALARHAPSQPAPWRRAHPVAPAAAPRRRARRLASTVTAAGLVAVMGASGAVAASHDALPGTTLYPVKAATEQLVLAAPLPAGWTVERHLTFADRRLDEAAALVARDAAPALVAEALTAHARLMARAGELAPPGTELAGRVDAATAVAQRRLAGLLDAGLPDVAADQARAALSAAEARLDQRPATPRPVPDDARPDAPRPDPARPDPSRPDPARPDPARPDPARPDPARPDPSRPDPARPGTPQPGPGSPPGPGPHDPATRPDTPAPTAPGPRTSAPGGPGAPGPSQDGAPQQPAPTTPPGPAPQGTTSLSVPGATSLSAPDQGGGTGAERTPGPPSDPAADPGPN